MTKVYIVQAHNNKDMSDARRHGGITRSVSQSYTATL